HRPSLLGRVTAPVFRVRNKVCRRYAAKLQDPVADLECGFLLHGCPPCWSGSCLFSSSMFGFCLGVSTYRTLRWMGPGDGSWTGSGIFPSMRSQTNARAVALPLIASRIVLARF